MNLYPPKANIINLATWPNMLTYVIGVTKDSQSCVKFMTISDTISRVRCMKLRATCIDWCINVCYCHIYIDVWIFVIIILLYICVMFNEMCAWIWFELNFWWNICLNTILSSNDGRVDVISPVIPVWLVVTGTLMLAIVAASHHRSSGWLTS
jgi:hypothetical protein